MKRFFALFLTLSLFSCGNTAPAMAEGVVDISLTTEQLCSDEWLANNRPTYDQLEQEKFRLMKKRDISKHARTQYELDHIIPLSLGGMALDPGNTQLQEWRGPSNAWMKNLLEEELHDQVCRGKVPLRQAQVEMGTGWERAFVKYIGPLTTGPSLIKH